jgi:hypothetical protein
MIHAQLYHAGQEVVISRRAAEAVLRGAHVFVPGALANPTLPLVWDKSLSACCVVITTQLLAFQIHPLPLRQHQNDVVYFSHVKVHCRSGGLQPKFA